MKKFTQLLFVLLLSSNFAFGATTYEYICVGGSIQLHPTTTLNNPSYTWTGTGVQFLSSTTSATPTFTPNSTISNYTLSCDMRQGNNHEYADYNISVCPVPAIQISVPNNTVCQNSSVIVSGLWNGGNPSCHLQFQLSTNNGSSWNNVGASSAVLQYCNATMDTFNYVSGNLAAGNYQYRAVDSCSQGCGIVVSNTVSVSVLANPVGNPLDTTICNHTTYNIPPSSNSSNVHYQWTVGNGTTVNNGNIAGTTANTDTVNVAAVYHVTPILDQNNCSGNVFDITVRARPSIVGTSSSTSGCNTSINISPGSNISNGIFYQWSRTSPPTPIVTGTGNIVDALSNNTSSPVTYSYSVTPSFSNSAQCPENAFQISYTLNPKPVGNEYSGIGCSNTAINYAPTANFPAGISYVWTRTNPASAVSHSGNIIDTIVNNTSSPVTYTYSVTPSFTAFPQCSGNPFQVTYTVNPAPVGIPISTTLCNNSTINYTPTSNFTTGVNYIWQRTSPTSGTSHSGNIIDTLTNTTTNPLSYIYSVTPTFSAPPQCPGNPFEVRYTVYPAVTGNPYSDIVCSNTAISYHPTSNLSTGVNYNWHRTNPLPALSNSGNIIDSLVNNTSAPVVYTYNVTPSFFNAPQCAGTPQTVSFTVQPALIGNPHSETVCSGTSINLSPTSNFATGVNYSWQRTEPLPSTTGTGNITDVVSNTISAPVNYVYSIVPAYSTSPQCPGNSFEANYTINPLPTGSDAVYNYCAGEQGSIPLNANPSSTFSWQADNGTNGNSSPIAFTTNDALVNETTYTYQITPTSTAGCVGAPFHIQTLIHPLPLAPEYDVWQNTLCLSSSGVILSIHQQAGYSYQWNFNPALNVSYNQSNTVAAFTVPSTGTVLSVNIQSTITATGCHRNFQRDITLSSYPAPVGGDIILAPGNELVYLNNTPVHYQWGYDDASFHSTTLTGETYQDYAAGSSLDTVNYFYWIIITDENGCTNKIYYNPPSFVSVNDIADSKDYTITPNPSSSGWFKISSLPQPLQNAIVVIYDTQGRLIKETKDRTFYLNNGIYMVAVHNGKDGKSIFAKTIVSLK